MIENIIIITVMVLFTDTLFEKWSLYDKLQKYGSKSKSKFIYKLTSCKFCILFHLGWVLWIVLMFFDYYGIMYVLTPFCVSGLLKLIKR